MKLFKNPTVRLAGRALVAGIAAALVIVQHSDYSKAAYQAAIVAGALSFCEVFTPLNSLVGLWKPQP